MNYRPDVDGLRAIAILAVVVYHAHQVLLPGGFIGVDVFFVISGYLITRLLASDLEQQRFSIARFYVRRTKRIFPALFVVLGSTLLLGAIVLTPTELGALGRTLAATAAFVSNIAFWQETGYFDVMAETKPLLHTWSLAVEEQFYFVWPLVLALLWKTSLRPWLRSAVFGIIAVSFVLSCVAVVKHPPSAFFLLPARAWELLTGAVLALGLVPVPIRPAARHASGVIGLALIGIGLFLLDANSAFPGWHALWPSVGTALLIAAGERGDHVVAKRLLTTRPMIFVGLISYSLYLWHWPLLSLARIVNRNPLDVTQASVIVGVAVILSVLTWKFVEQPFRAHGPTGAAAPILIRYAFVSIAAFAIGASVFSAKGFMRFARPEIVRAEVARYDVNPLSGSCLRWQSERGALPGDECAVGRDRFKKELVVWGDSHADAVAPGVVQYAADHGFSTYQLTMAACPPLLGVNVEGPGIDAAPCAAFGRKVIEHVTTNPAIEVVMMVGRWPLYTEGARFGPEDPGPVSFLVEGSEAPSGDGSKQAFARALERTVRTLRDAGKKVIVLGAIPPLGINVPNCLARNYMPFSGQHECTVDAASILEYIAFADQKIEQVTGDVPGVCSYMPKAALCAGGRCLERARDEILYANDDHLSSPGALFLARHFTFERCMGPDAPARPVQKSLP